MLLARGKRPNQRKKSTFSLKKKKIPKCKTTTWSAEKQSVEQTIIRIRQSPLSAQAVPVAGSIF